MSPRSEELMAQARERLAAAETLVAAGLHGAAVSSAYYAMLYAARAALSEEDRNAKTHRGTWDAFRRTFVDGGRFDADLAAEARRAQRPREAADYDAVPASREEALAIAALAGRFVAAVEALVAAE